MNEVENEDLVFTLETIVDKFGEEMAPYALGLCQNLVIFFPIYIWKENCACFRELVRFCIITLWFSLFNNRQLHFGGV